MRGLSNLKTPRKLKRAKRSLPRMKDESYLDLYILKKEKTRLQQEISVMEKRRKEIGRRIEDIDKEMAFHKEVAESNKKVQRREREGTWTVLPLNY